MAESAAADASGAAAVQASKARSQLTEAQAAPEDKRVRFVAGKSFVQKGQVQAADGTLIDLWVDTALDEGMTPRPVAFASAEYFALAEEVQVARWLSLSPALVLVIDGAAVQIVPDDAGVTASPVQPASQPMPQTGTAAETAAETAAAAETPFFWQRLFDRILVR